MTNLLASGKTGANKYDLRSNDPNKVLPRLDVRQIAQNNQRALQQTQGYSLSGEEGSASAIDGSLSIIDDANIGTYDDSMAKMIQTYVANASRLVVDGGSTANSLILNPPVISPGNSPNGTDYSEATSLPFAYKEGLRFTFLATLSNTGAVQVQIPGLSGLVGSVDLVDENGNSLIEGDVVVNNYYTIIAKDISGDKFILERPNFNIENIKSQLPPVTDYAKTLLDDNNASEARTTLGIQQNVVTTEGDLIKGSSGGETERLPVGSNNQILQSNGTNPVWSNDIVINDLTINNKLNTQPNSATISSGAIAYTSSYTYLIGEGSADDNLDTINGGTAGDRILLKPQTGTITIRDNDLSGGNIALIRNSTRTLRLTVDTVELIYDGGFWLEVASNTDFDFANSKATNGYTYLPNGILIQWGYVAPIGPSVNDQLIIFPITFNNVFHI